MTFAIAGSASTAAACVPTPWGGPCIGGAPSGSAGGGPSSNNGGGNAVPDRPSGMLLTTEQIGEKHAIDAAVACRDALDGRDFEGAIDRCRTAVERSGRVFGATSARAAEAGRLLAFAQNQLAGRMAAQGRCAEATALYRDAVAAAPSMAEYAHNLSSVHCASTGVSDLRVPPPPPPVARLTGATIALTSAHDVPAAALAPADPSRWQQLSFAIDASALLAPVRRLYHDAVPLASRFLRQILGAAGAAQVGHGAPAAAQLADQITTSRELGFKYREQVAHLVDQAMGAAHETVSIMGDGEGSAQHVIDAPEPMAREIDQFAGDGAANSVWSRIRAWGSGVIVPRPVAP